MWQVVRYGASREPAPTWLTTLILAEKWHTTPDVVAQMRGGLRWAARQAILDKMREKSRKLDQET